MNCRTAKALRELYDHTAESLPDDKLEVLAGNSEALALDAENIGHTLSVLASVSITSPGILNDDALSAILWGLSYRAETLAVMINISGDADYQLRERQGKANDHQPKVA